MLSDQVGLFMTMELTSMIGHLWKLGLVVALSHGYRLAGQKIGPRWAGLITALPCSTAIALLGGGNDRGLDYAVTMANACWVGLAGASALPLAFASATVAGWGVIRSITLGVVSYFAVMVGMILLGRSVGGNFPAAILFLALATWLAHRVGEPLPLTRGKGWVPSPRLVCWLRTVVPATCVAIAIGLGERLGPTAAGCLGSFPGVTLTVLVMTRLEVGPVAATRMARMLPPGNWAMVAFLATFTQTVPTLDLWGSVLLGYVSALICLGAVAQFTRPPTRAELRNVVQIRSRQARTVKFDPTPGFPRSPRRFSPFVESIAA